MPGLGAGARVVHVLWDNYEWENTEQITTEQKCRTIQTQTHIHTNTKHKHKHKHTHQPKHTQTHTLAIKYSFILSKKRIGTLHISITG